MTLLFTLIRQLLYDKSSSVNPALTSTIFNWMEYDYFLIILHRPTVDSTRAFRQYQNTSFKRRWRFQLWNHPARNYYKGFPLLHVQRFDC